MREGVQNGEIAGLKLLNLMKLIVIGPHPHPPVCPALKLPQSFLCLPHPSLQQGVKLIVSSPPPPPPRFFCRDKTLLVPPLPPV